MATPGSVKVKIQDLIDSANATTGRTDDNLTDCVNSLIEGYGQGGIPEIPTEAEMNSLLETAEVGSVYKYAEGAEDSSIYEKDALYIVEAVVEVKYGNFLTFSSPKRFTLSTSRSTKSWDGILEYSTDADTWNEWNGTTTLSADDGVLYMRGTGNTVITGASYRQWLLFGTDIACEGNIENLLDYATVANGEHPIMRERCYVEMFYDCTSLTTAPELPATTLAISCYSNMFYGCTSLTTAPSLPATTLANYCYNNMFSRCTSLTTAPELPATTLANYCYRQMFSSCTSLTTAPSLPATTLAQSCYRYMFSGCTNIKLSTTQTGEYQTPYRIPTSGTGTTATDALLNMFESTGGTFTGTPSINTPYYTSNTVI